MEQYNNLVSVNHQGIVIVFGRHLSSMDIFYNILSSDGDTTDLDWGGFIKLDFTTQVRQVGMSIITLDTSLNTMTPTSTPFRVVTDQKYISIVQQSGSGTLYINRFTLLKTKSDTNQKDTVYLLSPAWEVRYSRSGKENIPADKSDTQTYLTPDNRPFIEPSLELSMVDSISNGAFDVILLPISGSDLFAWQFFTLNKTTNQISLYNFPATSNGLFNISGKAIRSDCKILPDSSFAITDGKENLNITNSPRSVVYTKHEKVLQSNGKTIGVKRASRVMISIPGTIGANTVTATIDSAIGTSGIIAKLTGSIKASAISPAKFDLLFNGVGNLTLKPSGLNKNPLEVTGVYTMAFLLLPSTLKNNAMIIGGSDVSDPKTLAPYAKIVDGGKLQVGFGDGTKEINCTTQNQIFGTNSWTEVKVEYNGKGATPFVITVNGTVVPISPCIVNADPRGKAIDMIGNQTNGFIGSITSILITIGSIKVVDLACDSVNYSVLPSTTPNNANAGIVVEVHGPSLEPSSAPVSRNMSGTFYIDDIGLTYYVGTADFIEPLSSTCLMSGSDGMLHLYYQGKDNKFSVAQFSTLSARATFYVEWKTEKATNTQKGFLNFQAQRVGTYMNNCSIVVLPSGISNSLCDITVTGANDIGTEVWKGLPRSINKLAQIWNGAGGSNPDNQGVINGTTPYYDYNEITPSVIIPNTMSESGSYFQFTSVPSLPLNIESVEVTAAATTNLVNLVIESTAPDTWNGKKIIQEWSDVSAVPHSVIAILAGKSTSYDYTKVTTPGTKVYGIQATTGRSDEQISNISVFVQDSIVDFNMKIDNGSSANTCNVIVCGKTLTNILRDQNDFIKILNGEDKSFQYPDGYLTDVTTKIYAITNGLTASVLNSNIKSTDILGPLPYARLLRLIYTGDQYGQGYMSPIAKTTAKNIQGAKLTFNKTDTPLTKSLLFSVFPAALPTNGATGKIQDTSSFGKGSAGLLEHGVNGGWMQENPRFCLGMNKRSTNYVNYNVEKNFSPSDELAISSDLTLQTWINQDFSVYNSISRIITYNVQGNKSNPELPIKYMVGSKQGSGLILKNGASVLSSYNFTPPNLTMQIYVKPTSSKYTGLIYSISQIMGSTEFLNLSLDNFGKPNLTFMGKAGSLVGSTSLRTNQFTCLTVTITDAGNGRVALSLYNNADNPQTVVLNNTFSGKIGTLKIGTNRSQDLEMTVNGASFWQRALNITEVQNSYNYGFNDNDENLGIRWNFAEGSGSSVINSAATGSEFDSTVINPAGWDLCGAFFVPYAGRNNYILQSNRILKGWTNIALASKQGYGIKLNGSNSGAVSDGEPFNPGSSFAIEAWINPESLTKKQVIVEKPGSYMLYTNTLGFLCFKITITQAGEYYYSAPVTFNYEIKTNKIVAGKTSYIVVNFTSGSKPDSQGSQTFASQKYYINTSIYIDGQHIVDNNTDTYEKSVAVNQKTSSFYVGIGGDSTFKWTGLLSNIRVWGRTLNELEIGNTAKLHMPPTNKNGLVAAWNFDENTGTVAKDLTGKNNLQLTSNQLWTIWQDLSYANIYVNGRQSVLSRLTPTDVGDYNDTQFTVGGTLLSPILKSPYSGEVGDIRLFSTLLTEQQIYESMNSVLVGNEDNLAAYWKIDVGSGRTLYDLTGRGNNGTLTPSTAPPTWNSSKAPISNESSSVSNILSEFDSANIVKINGEPSVVEYGSLEKDAYGNVIGVLKRGYFYLTSSGTNVLESEYKVGDLDSIYIGQVQSKPSVVGFIEGGPPLPSENQTIPYWTRATSPTSEYDNACSVTYQESETETWTFSGSQSSTFESSFNIKGGFYQKSKTETSVGLGAEAQTMVLENKLTLGAKGALSGKLGDTDGVTQSHGNTISLSNTFAPSGTWEPSDNILNRDVGRRYIQNNIGIAIVKSATADLYMLALKGTLTPVTYSLVPNTTIPIDTNIIEFPINPKYIKNGTLDGKVGLKNDPDYPDANTEKGSYFKPVEAYAIKQKIEKEEEQLNAYYNQFSQDKYRAINSLDNIKDKLKENTAYDFKKNVNKRSIFNNYVWSAGGGMHKEEHSVANSYSENYTGASSLTFAAGLEFKMDLGTPFGGYYLETDSMLGNTWQMTATKSKLTSNNFSLICKVVPSSILCAPIITNDPVTGDINCTTYGTIPSPGKVDTYRYMSLFLAPSNDNFTALKTIIDPNWLANSTTSTANAMREAVASENGAWRIMYRTTYVSRVPAPFQPVQSENVSPNVDIPANTDSNTWIISIIEKLISKENPTPLEIGTAIENILGKDDTTTGTLGTLIPWWGNFLKAANKYGTTEFNELSTLREDLLQYMINVYASNKYLS